MSSKSGRSSYSFYVDDEMVQTIDDMDGVARSEAARIGLQMFLDETQSS